LARRSRSGFDSRRHLGTVIYGSCRLSLPTAEIDLRTGQEEQRQDDETPLGDRRNRSVVAVDVGTRSELGPLELAALALRQRRARALAERVVIAAGAQNGVARDFATGSALGPDPLRSVFTEAVRLDPVVGTDASQRIAAGAARLVTGMPASPRGLNARIRRAGVLVVTIDRRSAYAMPVRAGGLAGLETVAAQTVVALSIRCATSCSAAI